MRNNMVKLGIYFLGVVASATVANASVMTEWTFESIPTPSGTASKTYTDPNAPEVNLNTGTTSFSGAHAAAAVFSSPAGNGSAKSLSSNTWAVNDYYQFDAGTGYAGMEVEFDQVSSSTGPVNWELDYATDGVTFTQFATYTVSSSISFATGSAKTDTPPRYLFDLSGVTALPSAGDVTFRLIADSAGTMTSGTDRVDNVTVGTNLTPPTVPEPTSISLAAVACAGLHGRRRSR